MAENLLLESIFNSATPKQKHTVAEKAIGHGCDITEKIDSLSTVEPILNFRKLVEEQAITISGNPTSQLVELTGSNYSETNRNVNSTFGASFGIGGFQNSLSTTTNNSMQNKDTYEYGVKILVNKLIGAHIKPAAKAVLKNYLLPDAYAHIAGEPDSKNHILYPTGEQESLKKLFRAYGTHIVTKAIFGCKYEYYMLREKNEWTSNIMKQVNHSMGSKLSWKDQDLLHVSSNNNFSEEDRECFSNSIALQFERRVGGNTSASELVEWQLSCDFDNTDTIAFIGFDFSPKGSTEDSGLVPLWDLVDNQERKDALMSAYESYLQDKYIPIVSYKRVIADVLARHFDNGSAPEYFYEVDKTGGVNMNRRYIRLNENMYSHITASKKGKFYFYYALGYADKEGLTGIEFRRKQDTNDAEWIRRGNTADTGIVGVVKDYVVAIRKASRDEHGKITTDPASLITGFGVAIGKNKYISKGTNSNYAWSGNHGEWYAGAGLIHDTVKCITTTQELANF